jgi:hypothetical protein
MGTATKTGTKLQGSKTGMPNKVTLNYSDSSAVDVETIQWADNGVRLRTKWSFPAGAELEFGVQCSNGKTQKCSGFVVACDKVQAEPPTYITTVFFVEPPCDDIRKTTQALSLGRSGAGIF